MIFRQLTSQGDWTFGAGLACYAQNQQAIALNIQTSILMWSGDCFFSLSGWVNWKGLLNTISLQNNLNVALTTLLMNCYGVMAVNNASVTVNSTTRITICSYTVTTVYSTQLTNQVQLLSGQQQVVI